MMDDDASTAPTFKENKTTFSLKIKLQLVNSQIEHQQLSYTTHIISVSLASLS
jgi:hypothetical protein